MKSNSSDNQYTFPISGKPANRLICGFSGALTITLLGASCASAALTNPFIGGGASALAPQTAGSHMDAVVHGFSQFLHWQMMLRLLLGFALAVGCGWFIAWHPAAQRAPTHLLITRRPKP